MNTKKEQVKEAVISTHFPIEIFCTKCKKAILKYLTKQRTNEQVKNKIREVVNTVAARKSLKKIIKGDENNG
jgi:hypothetical protein